MIAARSAADTISAATARRADDRVFKATGLAFAALVPALFWTGLIAAAGPLLGYAVPPAALMALGATIALFLTAVCAPIMLRT